MQPTRRRPTALEVTDGREEDELQTNAASTGSASTAARVEKRKKTDTIADGRVRYISNVQYARLYQ